MFNDTIYENVARELIGSRWEEEPEEVKRSREGSSRKPVKRLLPMSLLTSFPRYMSQTYTISHKSQLTVCSRDTIQRSAMAALDSSAANVNASQSRDPLSIDLPSSSSTKQLAQLTYAASASYRKPSTRLRKVERPSLSPIDSPPSRMPIASWFSRRARSLSRSHTRV